MRFYLDEDLSPIIAHIVRRHGIDIATSHERGQNGKADKEHLRYAASEGRTVITENRGHFIAATFAFQANKEPHAGVLLLPKSLPNDHFSAIATATVQYDCDHPDGMPPYTVDWLRPARDDASPLPPALPSQ